MLNNELINRVAPWQEKGRWYHAFVESDGSTIKLTLSDLEGCGISGTSFTFPKGFVVTDVKCVDLDLAAGKTLSMYTRGNASGKPTINLPSAANFTYYEFYFFGYFRP